MVIDSGFTRADALRVAANVPEAISGTTLSVDGETIELRGTSGELAHRPYVWIPSIKAIVGNIAVFGNLHVWTADTKKPSERQAWRAQLDEMQALKPALVVPGHMAAGTALDDSAIVYTRDYLKRFEAELAKAQNAAQLIATMQKAYPKAGLGIALDIGAKVNTGEMKW
jgi:glyoxylase-like metal-dependent hydrolase (beta-lactamase superfamily II)